MELRSSRKRNEYKELQITLNGMGFYEEGMELQEMRHILDALHQSVSGTETNFFDDDDMERALRESEMDFMPSNNARLWNSTMMGSHQSTSPCSSPEIPPQVIIVQAEVHHPLNWSPQCSEEERLQRKRFASTPTTSDNNEPMQFSSSCNENTEPDVKRIHQYEGPTSIPELSFLAGAPGVNLNNNGEELLHSSLSTSHEDGGNSTIQIVGPISMRRPINDSGVNSSNETDKSSSLSMNHQSSSEDSNTNENVSLSSIHSHEIVGPISVRRPINDSGVVVSNETEAHFSSSWDFNTANGNSVGEVNSTGGSRLPYSLENDYDDEYEHSEPSM